MVTLSKPISAGQAQAYHKGEFANARENYYTEGERVRGEMVRSMEHRAGWDATFSAPKSVPLTALVGGDDRVVANSTAKVAPAEALPARPPPYPSNPPYKSL